MAISFTEYHSTVKDRVKKHSLTDSDLKVCQSVSTTVASVCHSDLADVIRSPQVHSPPRVGGAATTCVGTTATVVVNTTL